MRKRQRPAGPAGHFVRCLLRKRAWDDPMADRSPPRSRLQLEWVYGYRGHQCRNNLWYNAHREIVYFTATIGIVYNPREARQRFFTGHNDDILCLTLHPHRVVAASGQIGKSPYICVWDTMTAQPISVLKNGHTDGISTVAFSGSGNLLASVGLDKDSTINAWDWPKGRLIASVRGHSDRVFDIQFHPLLESQLVSCGMKHIKFWTLKGNTLADRKGIFGKVGEIQTLLCLAFGPAGFVYSGTLGGDIYVWKNNILEDVIKNGHRGAVITMHKSDDGFVTGGKDGAVRLWDAEFKALIRLDLAINPNGYNGLCVRSVCWWGDYILVGTQNSEIFEVAPRTEEAQCLVRGHAEGELWGLAIHPRKLIFATTSDDYTVRKWSIETNRTLCQTTLNTPPRSCAFSPDGLHLSAGLKDGSFLVLDASNLRELMRIKDRHNVIHEMKYSPDGVYLAVGSNDNFVDIYNVLKEYRRVGQCSGCTSFVSHLDWSVNSLYLQINSAVGERLICRVPDGKRVTHEDEISNISWSSWTCVLGPEVHGIWPKYSDKTDVSAADAYFAADLIATGDHFGLVKLFRFPCYKKGAKFHSYGGHSAHVTNIRFTHDRSRLISTGGADQAIFQWLVLTDGPQEDTSPMLAETAEKGRTPSLSEGSDSEATDEGAVDSDIEAEKQMTYERATYKDDVALLMKGRQRRVGVPEEKRNKAPDNGLLLHFVFGYRGYDCRNNVLYTQKGEVVYHVAAIGIVYNRDTHQQQFYLHHTDDILCLCIHPAYDIIATGQVGRTAPIHIWDAETLETLSILKAKHERGVAAVDFSGDGKKLASVGLDESHCVVVWDWKTGQMLASVRGHSAKIFVIKWNPHNHSNLVTVGINHIKFWTQIGGGFTVCRGVFGRLHNPESILCAVFGKIPDVCYTGGASGTIYTWEHNVLKKFIKAHDGPVFSLHALDKGFVSGGKDGTVSLWDEYFERCLKTYPITRSFLIPGSPGMLTTDRPPVRSCVLGHAKILVGTKYGEILEVERGGMMRILIQGHKEGEVWGLTTHPARDLCMTVSDDKTLRIWDTANGCMTACQQLFCPARCVQYSPDGHACAVGFKDGSFSVLSADTLGTILQFHHRKEEISDVKFSPAGKYLAVASHDGYVDIYHLQTGKRVGICYGNSSYITHIDWEVTGKTLQTISGARERLFFESPRGKQYNVDTGELSKLDWRTWTSVLGKDVEGMWPPEADLTDINAACRSHDFTLLATADDLGFVKLFDFPATGRCAKYKKYAGHGAHVTNVRWSSDDRYLISVGGADTAIIMWSRNGLSDKIKRNVRQDDSEESDSQDEEDGGYDSDVENESLYDVKLQSRWLLASEADGGKVKLGLQADDNVPFLTRLSVSRGSLAPPKLQVHEGSRAGIVEDLVLEHIHGYRGFDCSNNLHYLFENEDIVYHAARVGIVQNLKTGIQSFYLGHTDDIICLTVNQNSRFRNVIATGQMGVIPSVHVWYANDVTTLSVLQVGHRTGVRCVDFSSSGKLLVTVGADDFHTIIVWRWQEGVQVAKAQEHYRSILVAQFRPHSDFQFVTAGVKHVKFWKLVGGELVGKRGIITAESSHGSPIPTMLAVAFGVIDVTCTGAATGDVFIWLKQTLQRIVTGAHNGPILTMYTTVRDGLIVSGAKEKETDDNVCIKIWDQEMKRCKPFLLGAGTLYTVVKSVCRGKHKILVGTKDNSIYEILEISTAVQLLQQGHAQGQVRGLSVHPFKNEFVTASEDCTLRVWDIATKRMLVKLNLPSGGRCAHYSHDGEWLAVGMKTGEFLVIASGSMKVQGRCHQRSSPVNDIRFSPNGKLLAVGTEEQCVDFYDLTYGSQLFRLGCCKGIPSSVATMDFSADNFYLRVSTEGKQVVVFRSPRGDPVSEDLAENVTWTSWTSTLGHEVTGIRPRYATEGDVNCAHLCHSGQTIATGDDLGYVKLFDFPCPEKYAKSKKCMGHSAHIANMKFTHDDTYLVSTGSTDACVFVWKTILQK